MKPTRRNVTPLSYRKGTWWSFAWSITQGGVGMNLTDWKVRAQIREFPEAAAVLHEWTTENGGASVTDSRVALLLTPTNSAGWTFREAVYDVLLLHPTDAQIVYPVAEGGFTLRQGVTHA